jgi:hypothetical protein
MHLNTWDTMFKEAHFCNDKRGIPSFLKRFSFRSELIVYIYCIHPSRHHLRYYFLLIKYTSTFTTRVNLCKTALHNIS